jgi:hypothetical protein
MKSSYRGGTLEEFVLQRPKIPELEIMFIFYQIAQATNVRTTQEFRENQRLFIYFWQILHTLNSIFMGKT